MMLSLFELRTRKHPLEVSFRLGKKDISVQGTEFASLSEPLVEVAVSSDGSSAEIAGYIKAEFSTDCARCLTPVRHEIMLTLSEEWELSAAGEPDEMDAPYASFLTPDGQDIDLEKYAWVVLQEQMPLRVLCAEGCKGLCPVCGADQNIAPCQCEGQEIDPRLAVLGRLLQNKGGVKNGGS